eukprot:12807434-Ditylum_brightwellii.AAC.1
MPFRKPKKTVLPTSTSGLAVFVHDILLDNSLLMLRKADVPLADDGTRQRGRVNVTLDPKTTDHFVHSCMPFKDVMDISRQQWCIMCNAEGRVKMTSVYCGGRYQCFQHHVANCYINQLKNGISASQHLVTREPWIATVAGPQIISLKKKHKRKRKTKASVTQMPRSKKSKKKRR